MVALISRGWWRNGWRILVFTAIVCGQWVTNVSAQEGSQNREEIEMKIDAAKIELEELRKQRAALEKELVELQQRLAEARKRREQEGQNKHFGLLREKLDEEGRYLSKAEKKIEQAEGGSVTGRELSLQIEKIEDLLITALDIEIKIRNDIRPHLNAFDPEESARFSQLQAEVDSLSIVRSDLFKRLERIGSAIGSVAQETNLPQPTIYLVKKGDWLSKIAARREIYGDLSEWPRIYQANQDQIRDPDLIYPNQKFLIPR